MSLNHKKRKSNDTIIIKTAYRLTIANVSTEDDALIHAVMHKQQSAMRMAYNRLREGMKEKEVYNKLSEIFPALTGWDINAAIVLANETLDTQTKALARYIDYLKCKIEKLNRKSNQSHQTREYIKRVKQILTEHQEYQKKGTVPPAVFGGKRLWKDVVRKVPGALQKWRDKRSQQYFSQGETANYYGNRHFKLEFNESNTFFLSIRVLKNGKTCWIKLPTSYTHKQEAIFKYMAEPHIKKTIRLIRLRNSHFEAMITIDEPIGGREIIELPQGNTFAGFDINLNHIAIVLCDKQGQFRNWIIFKYSNLGELPKSKSRHIIGNLAKDIVIWLSNQHVDVAVFEDLMIKPSPNKNSSYNRRTIPFSHRQLVDAISRCALRKGINIKKVNPAFTSWIGELKYANMYGVSCHIAAAYTIARRGLGLLERLPADFVKILPQIAKSLETTSRNHIAEQKEKLISWKTHSPSAGHPWLLWIILYSIYKSGARDSHTNGRNYLFSLCHSAGNTRLVLRLTAGQDPPTQIMPETAYMRSRDKALGPT